MIPKGTVAAIYGCMLTERLSVEGLFWNHHHDGFHLKAKRGKWTRWVLNIRVCDETPQSYYVDNGLVGSIINDYQGSSQGCNVEEVEGHGWSF